MKSVNHLQRKIEGMLKWTGLVLLISYVIFFAVYFSLEVMHINNTASLWSNLFSNRMEEMEHMIDIRDKALPYANYFITDLEGNVRETSNEEMGNIRLNRNGLFGKLSDLKTNHVKIIFFPDMIDGTQRIHFAKRYTNQYAIYAFEPERFFPSFIMGKTDMMLEVDEVIWYSNNYNLIGDSYKSSPFKVQDEGFLISVRQAFPYIENTNIVIVENITIETLALFFSVLLLSAIIYLLYRQMEKSRNTVETELLQINEELEQSVAERTEMLFNAYKELEAYSYNISHDMKSPLMAIDSYMRLFMADYGDRFEDDGQSMLRNVRKICNEMVLLINKLLDYSKMGNAPLTLEEFDLSRLVREIYQEQASVCPDRISELIQSERDFYVRGDLVLVRNAIMNVLSNSLKFSKSREVTRIWTSVTEIDGETVYQIRDNGIGFDMTYADKLFNVFQRLHDGDEYEGSGIGLAAVKRVIEKHGGRIWIESVEGEGTVVSFTWGGSCIEC